jgi:hypothetical protein
MCGAQLRRAWQCRTSGAEVTSVSRGLSRSGSASRIAASRSLTPAPWATTPARGASCGLAQDIRTQVFSPGASFACADLLVAVTPGW